LFFDEKMTKIASFHSFSAISHLFIFCRKFCRRFLDSPLQSVKKVGNIVIYDNIAHKS